MKVIFLDIDGVLNSERSFIGGNHRSKDPKYADMSYQERFAHCTIDQVACDLINRLLIDFDAWIVVSSSHRLHFKDGPNKVKELQEYMTSLGIHGERVIGWTPSLNGPRGLEIHTWLEQHPEVEMYVIFDDSIDMLEEQQDRFINTDMAVGVSAEDYRKATRLFGKPDTRIVLL